MREILFRGKCKETGRWFTGQYIHLHKTTYCVKEDYEADKENNIHQIVFEKMTDWGLPNRHLRVDVIPETVGQYTGLTDKNGNRIYENDILNCEVVGIQYPAKVVFKNGSFGVAYTHRGIDYFNPFTSFVESVEFEIIGNIHDNPELLKGE